MKPVVYTCITNQKDQLVSQPIDDRVRYVCFSDRPFKHPQWEFVQVDYNGLSDPRRVARRYKLLSHIYFPNTPTIWIDGRVRLRMTPNQMMDKYKGDLVIRRHHSRDCIYEEAKEVVRIGYEDKGIVNRQVQWLKSQGYPEKNGLHETGCIIRRPNRMVEDYNGLWYGVLSSHSMRDQLSCDYVSWKLNHEIMEMDRDDIQVLRHHRKTTQRL